MATFKKLRSLRVFGAGTLFVAANVVAGLFHYLFQVWGSRELSALEFSSLNAWFANLALFFVIGGVLQYAANFYPWPKRIFLPAVAGVNALSLILLAVWFVSPTGQTIPRAMMILTGASLFAWLLGQLQARTLFAYLAGANLIVGICKLILVLLPIFPGQNLERYSFALFACYIPALWLVTIAAFQHSDVPHVPRKFNWHQWAAPFILSVAAAVIPQLDLVLLVQLQSVEIFSEFARASLFYKGIYFLMLILFQWLLPKQIRGSASGSRLPSLAIWLGVAVVLGSSALTLSAPVIANLLGWDAAPPLLIIFLSCVNMSLLCWIFLIIQENCARQNNQMAAVAVAVLGVEAAAQLVLRLDVSGYFILAITVQMLLLALLNRDLLKNSGRVRLGHAPE